jgi:hypothetical protein
VKATEEEVMARALGLPLPAQGAAENANLTPLGGVESSAMSRKLTEQGTKGTMIVGSLRDHAIANGKYRARLKG